MPATGIDLSRARWRKSSYSNGGEGACVEVAEACGVIAVRDSKNPSAGHLVLTRDHFRQVISRIRRDGVV